MRYLLWILILCSVASAKTVHVTVSGGTPTAPYSSEGTATHSIQTAVNTLVAGDTCTIHGGIYYEQVTFPETLDGGASTRITIQGDTGEIVIIDGTSPVTGWLRCDADDAGLKDVSGTNHPNATSIFWATVPASGVPSSIYKFMLFENGVHCRISRWPNQTSGVGINKYLFFPVTIESHGLRTTLVDTTNLTQASDYWNGAYLQAWLHRDLNNEISTHTVTDFNSTGDTLTFTPQTGTYGWMETGYGTNPDAWCIMNHPQAIDGAGEYYINPTAVDGFHKVYFWPTSEANLTANITTPSRSYGFYAYCSSRNDYVTIQNITIRRTKSEGIYYRGGNPPFSQSIQILHCVAEDCGASGIWLMYTNDGLIHGCTMSRNGDRGGMFNAGSNGSMTDNTSVENGGTQLSCYTMDHGEFVGNLLGSSTGAHGNGISCYVASHEILVARNRFENSNLSTNNITNFVVYANVFNNTTMAPITQWVNGSGYHNTGYQVFLNNTVYSTTRKGMTVLGYGHAAFTNLYVVNNITDGLIQGGEEIGVPWDPAGAWVTNNLTDLSYNLYLTYAISQTYRPGPPATYLWQLHTGEVYLPSISPEKTKYDVFSDFNGFDYTLKTDSPAIGAGVALTAIVEALDLNTEFPTCDFTKDYANRSWASPPSMGAYETGAFTINCSPDLSGVSVEAGSAMTSIDYGVSGNNGAVAFSLTTVPTISTNPPALNSGTGVLTWTPSNPSQAGDYVFTIAATDQTPETVTKTLAVHCEVPTLENSAPVLDGIPNQTTTTIGLEWRYNTVVNDDDTGRNSSVNSWTISNAPAGMTIGLHTGIITYPTPGAGLYRAIRVTVSDNATPTPATDYTEFDLEVTTGTYYWPGFGRR